MQKIIKEPHYTQFFPAFLAVKMTKLLKTKKQVFNNFIENQRFPTF